MEALLRDVRQGLRSLGKSPGFAAAAVLILASGIAANTAVFSLFNALVLRPPTGIVDPKRLVAIVNQTLARRISPGRDPLPHGGLALRVGARSVAASRVLSGL